MLFFYNGLIGFRKDVTLSNYEAYMTCVDGTHKFDGLYIFEGLFCISILTKCHFSFDN